MQNILPQQSYTNRPCPPIRSGGRRVDIVFLLDATGSMQSSLRVIRANLRTYLAGVTNTWFRQEATNWRACIWGYRDSHYELLYGKKSLIINPFTSDIHELERQAEALVAEGGGDAPESLLDALYALATLGSTEAGAAPEPNKWRYLGYYPGIPHYEGPTAESAWRCVVAVTDAPCHPTLRQHPEVRVNDIMSEFMEKSISLLLVAPDDDTYEDISCFHRALWESFDLHNAEDDSDRALCDYLLGNTNRLAALLNNINTPRDW